MNCDGDVIMEIKMRLHRCSNELFSDEVAVLSYDAA